MILKKFKFYILLLFSSPYNRKNIYSKYKGITFGVNVKILHFPRWGSEPYLIKIGDNVTITRGVCFVTHDGGSALFRESYPGLNVFGRIVIGNNVFIGINSIIMPNVTIGNNVVIGSGSIVTRDIPDNVVVAGTPAKVLKSIEDYKQDVLRKSVQIPVELEGKEREKWIKKNV